MEFLRVVIANKAGPVLMIAFTNHALDHMLRSVLDARITQKIVRLGSRSADERIAEFSIEHVESVAGRSRLLSAFSTYRRALRDVEDEIKKFMDNTPGARRRKTSGRTQPHASDSVFTSLLALRSLR